METAGTGVRVTTIQPGDVNSELTTRNDQVDPEAYKDFVTSAEPTEHKILDPKDIGEAVYYAVSQPNNVAINEILVEPAHAPV